MNEVGQSKLVVRNRVLSIGKWRHWGGYSIYLDHDAVSDQRMGSIGIHRVNAPNPIVQPAKRVACKPLEPFRLEVIAEGNQLISRVNGETVADWRDPRDWFKNGRVNIIITHPGTQLKISKIEVKGVAVSAPKEEMEEGDPMQ